MFLSCIIPNDILFYRGCFLTSSLMATLSLSLTIPLTMVVDIFVKDVEYSLIFYIGAIPMMLSFIVVTLLTHYENWDPLMDCITKINRRCSRNNHMYRYDFFLVFHCHCNYSQ